MKSKKILCHFRTTGLLIFLVLLAVSCAKDNSPGRDAAVNPMLRIKVTVPGTKTISTRGLGETLEAVQDLNVIVYFDDKNPEVFYFDASDNRLPLESGANRMFEINGLNIVQVDQISIYLVANYGEPLSASNIGTPDDLKSLKLVLPAEYLPPENCVMFAYAGTKSLTGTDDIIYLDAELERTLAKVTLSVEGCDNLKEGLRITPYSFHIFNVPKEMWLAEDQSAGRINKASEANIAKYGYEMSINIGTVTRGVSIGDHNSQAFTLFLFENKQGKKENSDGETGKEATGDFEYASYIEVTANYAYSYFDSQNKLSQAVGDIIYRFCLGSNVDVDYNVIRNHHYQVTLVLDGWGGAKEGGAIDEDGNIVVGIGHPDASWRVDLDLSDWGFSGNSNIGGGAYYDSFGLSTNSTIKIVQVDWSSPDWTKWAGVRKNHSNGIWIDLVAEANASTSQEFFQFYIKPWRESEGYPTAGLPQYKEVLVYLEPASGGMLDEFVMRQWTPVKIGDGLYMERFENPDMLLAPWWTSGTTPAPSNNAIGWENTVLIWQDSPAAQIALRKAGIYWGAIENITGEIPNGSYDNMSASVNAAFYLPSKEELETMLNFTGDMTDPHNTYLPLEQNADYWTATVNESGEVCYWDGVEGKFKYTSVLTDWKRVRAIYRPSLDSAVDAMLGNSPWK